MLMKCPTCKNIATWEENPDRPFCSNHCKLVDLGIWGSSGYSIPGDHVYLKKIDGEYEEDL